MTEIKKMLAAVSAAMMLASVAGCGGTKTTNDDVTVVNVWSYNSHSKVVYDKIIKEWNETEGKENGIKINYEVKGGDSFNQSLELAFQSGTAPDMYEGYATTKNHTMGYMLSLDKLPGGPELIEKYADSTIVKNQKLIYDGSVYDIPVGAVTTQGLLYNIDMFKAAGIVDENGDAKPPVTWDELRECAKKLTDASKKQYGIIFPLKWGGWYGSDLRSPVMSSQGFADYNPATGKFEHEGMRKAMETIVAIKNDGSVYPGEVTVDNDSARALFAEGSIGMKFGYSFDVGVLNDQFPAKCNWGVAPYPVYDVNKQYKSRLDRGGCMKINANSKVSLDVLAKVFNFFISDKFATECYKEGVSIPANPEIAQSVKLDNAKVGWVEMAQLVKDGVEEPLKPETDYSGIETPENIFIDKVYTGEISIDEAIALMDKNANQAVENYYSINTDEQNIREAYIDPAWKPQLK